MATVYPFAGWRAAPDCAASLAAVPYDVVSRAEAVALARNNPLSFLHVTRPEIDLPEDTPPQDPRVYAQGATALHRLIRQGHVVHDAKPCYYAYALDSGKRRQVGVVLAARVADYEQNVVRKHELTRPDKENDRVAHIEATEAQTGKVFLLHRPHVDIAAVLAAVTAESPLTHFTAIDGVSHSLWRIDADKTIDTLTSAFAANGPLYIADGHHRAAAAARVARARRVAGASHAAAERILAVAFAADRVQILPYHRVVRDLNGRTPAAFLAALDSSFVRTLGHTASAPGHFGMYLEGAWHTLTLKPQAQPEPDAGIVARLDVSLLQKYLLSPLLGINDPRRDTRIDFIGGIRGDAELERRTRSGWAVAFRLHATHIDDLLAVADAGAMMPPKSTWFEPKLRDGLVTLRFDVS